MTTTTTTKRTSKQTITDIAELRDFLNPDNLREQDIRQRIYSKDMDQLELMRAKYWWKLDQLEAKGERMESQLLTNDFAEIIDRCHAVELVRSGRTADIDGRLVSQTMKLATNRLWIGRLKQLIGMVTFRIVQMKQLEG